MCYEPFKQAIGVIDRARFRGLTQVPYQGKEPITIVAVHGTPEEVAACMARNGVTAEVDPFLASVGSLLIARTLSELAPIALGLTGSSRGSAG